MSKILISYANFLKQKPLLANGLSSAFLFGTGDFLAQKLFPDETSPYDYRRTVRNAIYGGILFSPLVSKWYTWLSTSVRYPFATFMKAKPSPAQRGILNTICQTAADQLIWAPMGIPMYFVCMTFMEGKDWKEAKDKLNDKYWETLVNNWKVWPAFQAVNFYFVRPAFRLLTVNIVSILWNCYLSYENYREKKVLEQVVSVSP
ncbi:DEKNAAC100283 [Brettanomyces naardenensis]|uniref:Protein SYM1 n=1 Tax=Brettanomyces naardenensis TaxID=13370 RepID=A0A448YFN4_BRENA|nr:DEKNAAC100283 [Brettanomyces naardenensis]